MILVAKTCLKPDSTPLIYRNFVIFSDVEILWKRTVLADFRAHGRTSVFPQKFRYRKLSEIFVFNAAPSQIMWILSEVFC